MKNLLKAIILTFVLSVFTSSCTKTDLTEETNPIENATTGDEGNVPETPDDDEESDD